MEIFVADIKLVKFLLNKDFTLSLNNDYFILTKEQYRVIVEEDSWINVYKHETLLNSSCSYGKQELIKMLNLK
jgi:hypothetical protein